MRFSNQKFWGGLPFPSLVDLPNSETKPASPALGGRFFNTKPPRKPTIEYYSTTEKWVIHTIWNNMDGHWRHYVRLNKSEKDKYCSCHIYLKSKLKQKQQINNKKNPRLREMKAQICDYQNWKIGRG